MSSVTHWVSAGPGDSFRPTDSLPLTDRGFRYGMALFETVGVWRGRLLFLTEHLECLRQAAQRSEFPVEAAWLRQADEFLTSILRPGDHGVVRLHLTAGDGSPVDPVASPRLLLSLERRAPVAPEVRRRGYALAVCPSEFYPTLDGRKTHNYWPNLAALAHVRALGADEGIVTGPHGNVLSACMANLFLVSAEGAILTPATGDGARAGVVRRWILERGNIQETRVRRNELSEATGAFITNSWLGIMPVASINERKLPDMSVSSDLMEKYQCLFD